MKRIHWIELFAEIRANAVSLVSIELFVCLGIGLFCGIEWCGVALCNEAQRAFEQGNMHDLELQFPYGITEEDMRQVESVEGMSATEPAT
jgi:hypothetical protein